MSNYKYTDEGKAHLHSFDDKPLFGTTTVLDVLSKPLTWWAVGLALEKLGWMNSKKKINGQYVNFTAEERVARLDVLRKKHKKLSNEAYLALLDEAYRAHSEKKDEAAVSGTELHADVEAYIKSQLGEPNTLFVYTPQIEWFVKWANENVKKFLWSEMNVYSETMWTGGIVDFGYETKDGKIMIGDIKSAKDAYMSHFLQVAGYAIQLAENGGFTPNGDKMFEPTKVDGFAIFPFGSEKKEPRLNFNVQGLQEGFKACVTLHKLNKQFE